MYIARRIGLVVGAALLIAAPGSLRAAELLGLYLFENNYNDSSGNGNDLAITVFGSVPFAPGFQGQGTSWSANSANALQAPIDVSQQNNPTTTWGAWVNTNLVAQQMPLSVDNGGWDRMITTNGNRWGVGTGSGNAQSSAIPQLNTWEFVATSWTNSAVDLHVNGQVFNFAVNFGANPSNTFLDIGRNANGAGPWSGLIDSVFVFDDALSVGQVQAIRNLALSPLGYHPGQADELLDLADGTITGTVQIGDYVWSLTNDPFVGTLNDGEVAQVGDDFFLRIGGTGLFGAVPPPPLAPEPGTLLLGLVMVSMMAAAYRVGRRKGA